MSRMWVFVPAAIGGVIGAALGWSITSVGCRPEACPVSAALVAVVAAAVCALGVGVVMVLVVRSLEEWREAEAAGSSPPGPGCETPDP